MKQITKYVIKNSLKRILLYRDILLRLKKIGVSRVYSYMLAQEAGGSPEQVRKDFSEYNIKGNHKGGYQIADLLRLMENLLFENNIHNIVLIGMGNIGKALANYSKFIHGRINIVAAFDIDPSKHSSRSGIAVYGMGRLQEVTERFNVLMAIVAVPEESAQEVCNYLIKYGVKGIINFAPIILKVPEDVMVNNVNLCNEIESVIYCVSKELTI